MIKNTYEVGDLVEYLVGYSPVEVYGVVIQIETMGRPVVQWLDGPVSSPDFDRLRPVPRVEAKNAV